MGFQSSSSLQIGLVDAVRKKTVFVLNYWEQNIRLDPTGWTTKQQVAHLSLGEALKVQNIIWLKVLAFKLAMGILLEPGWIRGFLIYLLSSLAQRKALIQTVHWLYLNSLIQVIKGGTIISSETYLMNKLSKLFREFLFPSTHKQTNGYGLPLLMGKYQWNQLIGLAGERTRLLVKMCQGEKFGKPRFMRD